MVTVSNHFNEFCGQTAEWFSHGEMIKLQGVSVLMSVNEWQYKDIVDENDNQVWDCMTEEWTECMYGEGNGPAL